jgi:hypothetical protein
MYNILITNELSYNQFNYCRLIKYSKKHLKFSFYTAIFLNIQFVKHHLSNPRAYCELLIPSQSTKSRMTTEATAPPKAAGK